jgi:DNA-binding protein YbaB
VSAEFDQLVAQFEQFQSSLRRIDDQFAAVGQMQRELAELEAVATSPDRSVTVVAGPSGSIKDIRVTDVAMRQSPQALSAALMSTLRQAVAEAARRQAGIVETTFGDEMHLTEQVLETQAELFGTTPDELRATTEQSLPPQAPPPVPPATGPGPVAQPGPLRRPAPPRRPTAEESDDFSQENFLRRDSPQSPPTVGHQGQQGERFLNLYDEDER